jgi:hypothetical protein
MDVRYDILEMARFLAELSVIDYFFVLHRPSVVALAALLNGMDAVPGASDSSIRDLESELKRIPGLDLNSLAVQECRERLQLLYSQGDYSRPDTIARENRTETISPVCVSYGIDPNELYHSHQESAGGVEDASKHFNYSVLGVEESQFQFEGRKRSAEG